MLPSSSQTSPCQKWSFRSFRLTNHLLSIKCKVWEDHLRSILKSSSRDTSKTNIFYLAEGYNRENFFFFNYLRAVVSNFQESGDRSENSNFFLFSQKDPFAELFSKIIFKSSSEFLFWQKLAKFVIGLNLPDGPIEIVRISTFSKLSFKTRKRSLELMFSHRFHILRACFQIRFYLDLNIITFEVSHVKNTMLVIP